MTCARLLLLFRHHVVRAEDNHVPGAVAPGALLRRGRPRAPAATAAAAAAAACTAAA